MQIETWLDLTRMRNQVTYIVEIWKGGYEERVKKCVWDWHGLATKASQWNLSRVTRSGKLSAIFISSRNFKWEVETRSRYEEGKRWKSQRLVHAKLSHNSVLNREKNCNFENLSLWIWRTKRTLLINNYSKRYSFSPYNTHIKKYRTYIKKYYSETITR